MSSPGVHLPVLPTACRVEKPDSVSPPCRSSQYSMVATAGRENGMETPMHENPEWEKARQALASISKAGAASSSAKASSSGPVASAQVRRLHGPWARGGVLRSSPVIAPGQGALKDALGALMWGKQGLCP